MRILLFVFCYIPSLVVILSMFCADFHYLDFHFLIYVAMDVDTALSVVGGYKIWHICLFGLVAVSQFAAITFHSFVILFIGWFFPFFLF